MNSTIHFNGVGPALSISLRYTSIEGEKINSVYTYRLWDADSNAIINKNEGNNLNEQDDTYFLPTPSGSNSGRIIDVFSTLHNNGEKGIAVRVEIEVCQGGETIDVVADPKKIKANGIEFSQVFITLLSN